MAGLSWEVHNGSVRPIVESDIEHIRRWRNDQQNVLRQQLPISQDHQLAWFSNVVAPSYTSERFPSAILIVMESNGTAQSYGGLTNIEWQSRRAELSFLAETSRARDACRYREEMNRFLEWVFGFAFDELALNRLFSETWEFRYDHIEVLESAGMTEEGRLREHVAKNGTLHDAVLHGILAADRSAP